MYASLHPRSTPLSIHRPALLRIHAWQRFSPPPSLFQRHALSLSSAAIFFHLSVYLFVHFSVVAFSTVSKNHHDHLCEGDYFKNCIFSILICSPQAILAK